MTALLATAVVATMYTDTGLMYCGGYTHNMQEPWLALPVGGNWQCGDLVYLRFSNGSTLMARALDAGPFGKHCVMVDNQCLPIIADIPQPHAPFPGLSAQVEYFVNFSAQARKLGLLAGGDSGVKA